MKKRLLSLLVCLAMTLSLTPAVLAVNADGVTDSVTGDVADGETGDVSDSAAEDAAESVPDDGASSLADSMTDIAGHWGRENIVWAIDHGLFNGKTPTIFAPDDAMTRGMFITVLGRMVGIDEKEYQDWYLDNLFDDVPASTYYAPYINWAVRYGITNGTGEGTFSPDVPVTREQMAAFLVRFAQVYQYEMISTGGELVDGFADADEISPYAADAVEVMRTTGILMGRGTASNGLGYFVPQATATRAEVATVFYRLTDALYRPEGAELEEGPEGVELFMDSMQLWLGTTDYLLAWAIPWYSSNTTLTWVSSDPGVARVTLDGKVTAVSSGTAEIYCYTANGKYAVCTVTCAERPALAYEGEYYTDKCIRIFGEVVDDPRLVYQNDAQASQYMVTITIPTWDFADASHTTKVTKYTTLTVHKNIAATVQAIFEEIYNGDEKFPICSIGGYSYRAAKASEHSCGLAIDINPDSNYYCGPNGEAITGSHWDPASDPYSIPIGGDVDQAFEKYGFTRGIYRGSYLDYMHYSYFGT